MGLTYTLTNAPQGNCCKPQELLFTEMTPWIYEEIPVPGLQSDQGFPLCTNGGASPSKPPDHGAPESTPIRIPSPKGPGGEGKNEANAVTQFNAPVPILGAPEEKSSLGTSVDGPPEVQNIFHEIKKVGTEVVQVPAPAKDEPEFGAGAPIIQSSVTVESSTEDKPKPPFGDDDPFGYLDWKDGIATLPGKWLNEPT